MDTRYSELVAIVFTHSYFNDGKLKGFRVLPSEVTKNYIQQYDLLLRTAEDGFSVYYNALLYGSDRTRDQLLTGEASLSFFLFTNDMSFFQYTDGLQAFVPGRNLFDFSNSYTNELLHSGEVADTADLITDNSVMAEFAFYPAKPLARLTIQLKPDTLPSYTIQFAARKTYWRYILSSGYLQQLDKPAVIGKQEKIVFKGPEAIVLPDKRKAVCFVSEEQIAFSETPRKDWQLVEQYDAATGRYKVVKKTLPAPDVLHLSVIDASVDAATLLSYSEIIL